jgi:hypothetical protein
MGQLKILAKKSFLDKSVCKQTLNMLIQMMAEVLRPAINEHKHSNIQTFKSSNILESWVKLDFYLEFSLVNKVF